MAAVAIGGFIGVQALGQFVRMENEALEACRDYLEEKTGQEIDLDELETTAVETVFPEPFDKRFRTTCTFGDVTVELESKPFKPWLVVGTSGLD